MKLNYKRTMLIGFAFLSISAFWQLYDFSIPLMIQNNFGKEELFTNIIMSLDNILALFLLPLLGALSDRCNTRIGKRMPFILIGSAVAVTGMMFLPFAANQKNFILFFVALGVVLLAMSIYRSPAVALMPDLTLKPLRSKGNAVINLMGAIGVALSLGLVSLLTVKYNVKDETLSDYTYVFAALAVLMAIAVIILFFTVKENKITDELKRDHPEHFESETVFENGKEKLPKPVFKSLIFILVSIFLWFFAYNAVSTAFSRYAQEVMKLTDKQASSYLMVALIISFICYIPIGFLGTRFGRKRVIIGGIVVMTICYAILAFITSFNFILIVCMALIGAGWAAINVNSLPMVVEMCKAGDVGKFTGVYYTFSMSAQIITPIVSGALLQYISYRTLFPYATLFSALALVTMLFVKHGDGMVEKKASIIENFDAQD